jgi:hypothetical protein
VLIDAASGHGDDYIMPDLTHDTRQMSAFSGTTTMHIYAHWRDA